MNLTIIILSYNTKDLLRKCLKSIYASQTNFEYEVLVPDNGSTDGSWDMVKQEFPLVKLMNTGGNIGFSKGNNVALRQAQGTYVLLLNPDTEVEPDTLDKSIRYMVAHKDVGAMGCKVLLPDGRLDQACRRRFPNPKNAFLRLFGLSKFSDYNYSTPIDQELEVDSIMGAYMIVPKAVLDQVGLLDEEYFMYGEDIDWCWRIKKVGYKVRYYPECSITHYKYGSSQLIPYRTINMAHKAMKIFYRKHYAEGSYWWFNQLVYMGINLRMYLVMLANVFRKKKSVH